MPTKQSQPQSSPLPWRVLDGWTVGDANGVYVAQAFTRSDAALIVAAVNSQAAIAGLVDALQMIASYKSYGASEVAEEALAAWEQQAREL